MISSLTASVGSDVVAGDGKGGGGGRGGKLIQPAVG
jgi:hypothetical protein